MKINLEIFEHLKSITLTSTYPKAPVASAIVHRNRVICFGVNQLKTHPYQMKYGRNSESIFWHSETNALFIADKKLGFDRFSNSFLYVARTKWDGTAKNNLISGLAYPCDGCMRCIKDYGIKGIIYTMDEDKNNGQYGVLML
jgi:deoxycytidylate deaminase